MSSKREPGRQWKAKRVPRPEDRLDFHHDQAVEDFDWPCDKRIAHGAHIIEVHRYEDPDEYDTEFCPGVLAHPAVMIGRIVKP